MLIIAHVGDGDREVEVARGRERERTTPASAITVKHFGIAGKNADPRAFGNRETRTAVRKRGTGPSTS